MTEEDYIKRKLDEINRLKTILRQLEKNHAKLNYHDIDTVKDAIAQIEEDIKTIYTIITIRR